MAGEHVTFEEQARFHGDVVGPDIARIIREEVTAQVGTLRDELAAFRVDVLSQFGVMGQRSVRVECECMAIKTAIGRLENTVAVLGKRIAQIEATPTQRE